VAFQAFPFNIYAGSGGVTTNITNNQFGGLSASPAINNSGTVAFVGAAATDQSFPGVLTGRGGPLTTIAESSSPLNVFQGSVSINDSRTVAFLVNLGSSSTPQSSISRSAMELTHQSGGVALCAASCHGLVGEAC